MAERKKSMLYTRSGDAGSTSLFGGGRVAKDSLRVEAYGCVDELNSVLGVAGTFVEDPGVAASLAVVQNELFNIGSELASETAEGKAADVGRLFKDAEAKIAAMEREIDDYDAKLPELRTFILASGSRGGAFLHLARTVCRRAERAVVRLSREEPVNDDVLRYLNRLSDLLFVFARWENFAAGSPETEWKKG